MIEEHFKNEKTKKTKPLMRHPSHFAKWAPIALGQVIHPQPTLNFSDVSRHETAPRQH
jgi:hypothetical protein